MNPVVGARSSPSLGITQQQPAENAIKRTLVKHDFCEQRAEAEADNRAERLNNRVQIPKVGKGIRQKVRMWRKIRNNEQEMHRL